MTAVPARDLRNHTSEVLRQVQSGTSVTVSVNGLPVAEIVPIRSQRPLSMPRADLIRILTTRQADPGLRDDLAELAGDSTDDLGAIG